MERYICIHGHFYQPPRENPWLEEVERQDSAYPYHDWNERITAECYAPNTVARILDQEGRIYDIISNYSRMSFNFGPTLLSWMERHRPDVYAAIIEADRIGVERFSGHGPAIAQAYSHMIMPLANRRDKHTQALWGIRDFERRFGRAPEGMWLPETAVDLETLEVLAELGIRFTLLAQRQAHRVRRIGEDGWRDVTGGNVDPTTPYLCRLPSGKEMVLFFYDGPISQELAFGKMLSNGEEFAWRLAGAFTGYRDWHQIVHIATDGESYGHHHYSGDMGLAYCLHQIENQGLARLTVYGEYLEKHPPVFEAEIHENSSWSCIHGIERWRTDCGCCSGMKQGWNQAWRTPLRGALDLLRDSMAPIFEKELGALLTDPWKARDDYVDVVLDRGPRSYDRFFAEHAPRELSHTERIQAVKLLEMQRHAMLMYTSCGWFFDEISGIETVQIMRYAARAIQLAHEVAGAALEKEFLDALQWATSNISAYGDGKKVWDMFVRPSLVDLPRVAAHFAVSSLFEEYPRISSHYSYRIFTKEYDRMEAGNQRVVVGRATFRSEITHEDEEISFAVIHFGDHNLNGGTRRFVDDEAFAAMHREMKDAFLRSDMPEVIRIMDRNFGDHNYSLWHLFRDEQKRVMDMVLESTLREIEAYHRQIYEHHYPVMRAMNEMKIPLPRPLLASIEFIINRDMKTILENGEVDRDHLKRLVEAAVEWNIELDKTTLEFVAAERISQRMEVLALSPEEITIMESIVVKLELLSGLPLALDIWKAQNLYFSIGRQTQASMQARAGQGDADATRWLELFDALGDKLKVRIAP